MKKINIELVDVKKNDCVLLAANIVIEKIDPEEAKLILVILMKLKNRKLFLKYALPYATTLVKRSLRFRSRRSC